MAQEELYRHIEEWQKFLRRHENNVFNALFRDIENLSHAEIDELVRETAFFFDMPLPTIYETCDTLAKEISWSDNVYSIYYNKQLLDKAGINNKDALKLLFTHEICHHVFRNVVFGLLENERWTKELVCDFITAVRSTISQSDTGKYKYAISNSIKSVTHPSGWSRNKAFLYRREVATLQKDRKALLRINEIIDEFRKFVLLYKQTLDEEWHSLLDIENSSTRNDEHMNIQELDDRNLIKQYVLYGKT